VLFKPCGIPCSDLQENSLTLDELESIRLADLERLYQEDAAARMGVSRQTFGNIIRSAHEKIADALVNARALKIAGGVVQYGAQHFRCGRCRNRWTTDSGSEQADMCPKCHENGIPENIRKIEDRSSQARPNKEEQL
jgi:predicted DNA-binding protein (UPF0251 family)